MKMSHRLAGWVAVALLAAPVSAGAPLRARGFVPAPGIGYVLVRLGPGSTREIVLQRYVVRRGAVELVPETFAPASPKEFDVAVVSGSNALAETPDGRLYLLAVRPGQWLIAAAGRTCFSLGTYGFEVRPGELTDIGTVLTDREDGRSTVPELAAARLSPDLVADPVATSDAMLVRAASEADRAIVRLKGLALRRAALVADLRFANVCGWLVNRAIGLPPLEHQVPLRPYGRR